MDEIIIIGARGLGKEVAYYIMNNNKLNPLYKIIGFIDDTEGFIGKEIIYGLKVIGNINSLLDQTIKVKNICIAISSNNGRLSVYEKIKHLGLFYPNIIDSSVNFDSSNTVGFGNIIAHHCMLTCNITLGNFNILNGSVGVGHDTQVGDFNYFGPRTTISGNIKMGDLNTIHMQSSLLEKISIGNRNTVNLHSSLFKSVKDDGVYFGVPAMRQRF